MPWTKGDIAAVTCVLFKCAGTNRTIHNITFLETCLKRRIVPRFIDNWFRNIPKQLLKLNKKAIERKQKSLETELIRSCISEQKKKFQLLEQDLGYVYLTTTRRMEEEHAANLLNLIGAAVAVVGAPLALSAAGFTAGGVAAGSVAAGVQSAVYGGATTGAFSVLQSAGAAGIGLGGNAIIAAGGGLTGKLAKFGAFRLWKSQKDKDDDNDEDPRSDQDDDENDDQDGNQVKKRKKNKVKNKLDDYELSNMYQPQEL